MDTPRTFVKIDRNTPGTEVSAETAAALATASLVFRKSDRSYSKLLLNRAIRVFQFADKYRGSYSNGLKKFVCPYYCSYSGYEVTKIHGDCKEIFFLPFISTLKERCIVHEIGSSVDYRRRTSAEEGFYFIQSGTSDFLMQKFKELIGEHRARPQEAEVVMGRTLQICN